MVQFNLEEYLKNPNRKVVTRNGLNVRILCTDRNSIYPIVALIGNNCHINTYLENGKDSSNLINLDLFFAPEKHEGWVNVCIKMETSIRQEKISMIPKRMLLKSVWVK